jgi:hypothetical protein
VFDKLSGFGDDQLAHKNRDHTEPDEGMKHKWNNLFNEHRRYTSDSGEKYDSDCHATGPVIGCVLERLYGSHASNPSGASISL